MTTPTLAERLLPCPFCGDDDPLTADHIREFVIWCGECGGQIRRLGEHRERHATEAWNRRVAAAALEGANQWRSIESAPKDGSWILLSGGKCNGDGGDANNRCASAQWTNCLKGGRGPQYERWQFAWYDGGYYGEYKGPTHWMPLPTGPLPVVGE